MVQRGKEVVFVEYHTDTSNLEVVNFKGCVSLTHSHEVGGVEKTIIPDLELAPSTGEALVLEQDQPHANDVDVFDARLRTIGRIMAWLENDESEEGGARLPDDESEEGGVWFPDKSGGLVPRQEGSVWFLDDESEDGEACLRISWKKMATHVRHWIGIR